MYPSGVEKMSDISALASELVDRISDRPIGPCRLIVLPFESNGLVTIAGSVVSCPDPASGDDQVQAIMAALLDKGTRRRDRYEIARTLESIGAERSYSSGPSRMRFSARCLKKAVGSLIGIVAEELREPVFEPRQFDLLRQRVAGEFRQSLQDTGALAHDALCRHWFDAGHPNHARPVPTELDLLARTEVEDIRSLHATGIGSDDMILVIVGDVKPGAVAAVVAREFGTWPRAGKTSGFKTSTRSRSRLRREEILVPGKPSISVSIGHGLGLTRRDPSFIPMLIGNFVLGGNFSSRLMQTIRDEMGLTYGIRSSLSGVSVHYDMLWNIRVTLSSSALDGGLNAIHDLVAAFVENGVTDRELERARETLTGSYLVRQDSAASMARRLLLNSERGYPLRQLADYPAELAAVKREEVNESLGCYLRPKEMSVAAAGTINRGGSNGSRG